MGVTYHPTYFSYRVLSPYISRSRSSWPIIFQTIAQWFKPLVKNGQNLKEFEYRDVVYVYRGFRPWEIDFQEKKLRKSNIWGARGAFKTEFLQISRFFASCIRAKSFTKLKSNWILVFYRKDSNSQRIIFFNLIFWAKGAHLRPLFTIFGYFLP